MTPQTDEWAKLTSLPSKYEADLLAGRLQEAGIAARTVKDVNDSAGWLKAYGNSLGPFDVYVSAAKTVAARQLLEGLSSPGDVTVDRPYHRSVQVIGRALILVSLIGMIVTFLWNVLR